MQHRSARLQGKVAIITGAAQGIGKTYALALAAAGQKADAAMNLRRGAELGPEPVRALDLAQLKKLQSSKSVHQ